MNGTLKERGYNDMINNPMTYEYGSKVWRNSQNEYHRDDGPAAEWFNGDKEWFINGLRHREDGPAVECADGNKYWFINGKLIT